MDEGLRKGEVKKQQQPWRVLEFYSGIGGMRYSLMDAGVDAQVVEAFDINDVANDVYQHNFSHRPFQGNIQTLSCADLDSYNADAWLLSPPCQPYTRQGLQKGSDDARAFSFLKILELIPHCSRAPLMLFVENVVGFETSDTHEKMVAMLRENHFEIQEFILSPLQFAVPYSRPRYFCLAKRRPMYFQNAQYNNKLLCAPDLVLRHDKNIVTSNVSVGHVCWDKFIETCRPIQEFLEFKDSTSELISDAVGSSISRISKDTEEGTVAINNTLNAYIVPPNLVERWGSAMDVVFPESKRCCCFTKSYYRYVKGTGSLLATVQGKTTDKANSLLELRLRYFTPKEVANLHSFPDHFQFPQHVSLRQRYALLGNSLSVGVVAPLLKYLFSHDES